MPTPRSAASPEAPTAPAESSTGSSSAGIAASVAAVTAWGAGNTLIAGLPLPGMTTAFLRTLAAALIYLPVLYARGGRLTRDSFRYGWNGGLAFGADVAAFFVALSLTTVANATTISALQPLVIMGFARVMFGERIHGFHVAFSVVAIGGVAMVAFGSASTGASTTAGDAMAFVATVAWAWYFIASKRARQRLETFEYMTVMNIVAFVAIAPVAALGGQLEPVADLTWGHVLGIVAIVLIPGSGHILINWAHQRTTLMTTSLITLAMPVISTVCAAIFLDEQVVAIQAVGIAVVLVALAGVIVADARRTTPRP